MKIISHRGGPAPFLENSVKAVEYSILHNADGVEVDFRFTADKIPVAFHDDSLERLFHDKRKIAECSMNVLEKFGSKRYGKPSRIENILEYGKDLNMILLHLKEVTQDTVHALMLLFAKYNPENIFLGISSMADMEMLNIPGCNLKFLAFLVEPDDFQNFNAPELKMIRLWESDLTIERITAVHDMGKDVLVMSGKPIESFGGVCSRENLVAFDKMNVDGVLLNDPALAVSF